MGCDVSIKHTFGTDFDLPFLPFPMISGSPAPQRQACFSVHRQSFIPSFSFFFFSFPNVNSTNHHSKQSGYGPCSRLETAPVKILFYLFYVGLGWHDFSAALTSSTGEMPVFIVILLLFFFFFVIVGRLQQSHVHH